jgi:enoyl-CoA hydratase/carnithine racemase
MDMLLAGESMPAREALAYGLVSRVVVAEDLEKQLMEMARPISSASGHTVSLGKKAFYQQLELDHNDAYTFAQRVMVDNLKSEDATEGQLLFE